MIITKEVIIDNYKSDPLAVIAIDDGSEQTVDPRTEKVLGEGLSCDIVEEGSRLATNSQRTAKSPITPGTQKKKMIEDEDDLEETEGHYVEGGDFNDNILESNGGLIGSKLMNRDED
ncbi:hypothetical protein AMTR_s00049p00116950 [Amborella trichopoda]|uniref:Uncharacterized protein n=1 Tax=Amborella trichopoda TaxID=13333 RepID=W1PUI0_AMBTC|nr:hypothetical protein AMTR_s00049p00116950 [Amborella trichopoda]